MRTSAPHQCLLHGIRNLADNFFGPKDTYSVTGSITFRFPKGSELEKDELEALVISEDTQPWVPKGLHPDYKERDLRISGILEIERRPFFDNQNGGEEYTHVVIIPTQALFSFYHMTLGEMKAYNQYLVRLATSIAENEKVARIKNIKMWTSVEIKKTTRIKE